MDMFLDLILTLSVISTLLIVYDKVMFTERDTPEWLSLTGGTLLIVDICMFAVWVLIKIWA